MGWDPNTSQLWAQAYDHEIKYFGALYPNYYLDTIFFGGGTPSQMPISVLDSILKSVFNSWPHDNKNIEITFEANPRDVTREKLQQWQSLGINRISLGVQSFDDAELQFLGRDHNAATAINAIDLTAEIFSRYSFDLIYGLPKHTPELWHDRILQALKLAPSHLSLYQLTIEPDTGFYLPFKRGDHLLPENEVLADLFTLTHDVLDNHGINGYEISSFAKAGEECRHNLHYWHYGNYLGIGAGGHSRIWHDNHQYAIATIKNPTTWRNKAIANGHGIAESETLTPGQIAIERLYMGLRLKTGLSKSAFTEILPMLNQNKYHQLISAGELIIDNNQVFL